MSAEPRDPATVENRTKVGVRTGRVGQELRDRVLGEPVVVGLEDPVRARAARVHHPFGNAFVVEVGDLLPRVEVLQQGRPALTDGQRVVGVVDPHPLVGGQLGAGQVEPHVVELALLVVRPARVGVPSIGRG
nr:hypothetical protein GCM10020241_58600 [Streptoalloteichus tenebrarius]